MSRKPTEKLALGRFLVLPALALAIFCTDAGLFGRALAEENAPTWVFVLRHAERGDGPDPHLTPDGLKRAEQLRHALASAGVSRIFVTKTNRSCETAWPLAVCICPEESDSVKCPGKCFEEYPYTNNAEADVQILMAQIFPLYEGKVVAVVAHSDTAAGIVQALTGKPLKEFDAAYDNLFVLSVAEKGKGTVLHLKYGFPATLQKCK
jgi:2,3-bisphosphoglycerate-dependent phosphoglycerate mutase